LKVKLLAPDVLIHLKVRRMVDPIIALKAAKIIALALEIHCDFSVVEHGQYFVE
jgi:hypothetical protein